MLKVLFYFLILSFFSYSTGELSINCNQNNSSYEAVKSFVNKSGSDSLFTVCQEAKQDTKACCYNPGRCSDKISSKIADSLTELTPGLTEALLKVKGATSGDPFENCQYNQMAQLVGPLGDSVKKVREKSCYDSVKECEKKCEDHYKLFLADFIRHFAVQGNSSNKVDNVNFENPEEETMKNLMKVAMDIVNECKLTKSSGGFKQINNEYQEGAITDNSFEDGSGVKDFMECKNILDIMDQAAEQEAIRQIHLQACQKAATFNPPKVTAPPGSVHVPNSPLPGQWTGNTDEAPPPGDVKTHGDNSVDIGDGIPEESRTDGFQNNGFGSLAGNSGLGGGPGGFDSGSGGGTGGDYNDGMGFDSGYGIDSPPEYWEQPTNSPSFFGGGMNDGGGSFSGADPNDSERQMASDTPLDLNQYVNHKREKSIFQMVSYRIQKYCEEKIKNNCL